MVAGHDVELAGQIKEAIGAHGLWKQRLKTAIHSGTSEIRLEDARRDDKCEFGKWLNGTAALHASSHYAGIKELHRKFHEEVGHALEAALVGNRAKAEAMVETGSAFAKASIALTAAMVDWSHDPT